MTDPVTITAQARIALDRYERAFADAMSETNARARVRGAEILRLVKSSLAPADAAIVELIVARGRSFALLAQQTGRKVQDLRAQFAAAAERLAQHFEAVAEQGD